MTTETRGEPLTQVPELGPDGSEVTPTGWAETERRYQALLDLYATAMRSAIREPARAPEILGAAFAELDRLADTQPRQSGPAVQGEGGGFPATDPEVQPPAVVGLSDRERRKLTDALYYWFDEKQVAARVEPVVAALVAQARTEGAEEERERIAAALIAVDPVEWALAGVHAGSDAAQIARRGGAS